MADKIPMTGPGDVPVEQGRLVRKPDRRHGLDADRNCLADALRPSGRSDLADRVRRLQRGWASACGGGGTRIPPFTAVAMLLCDHHGRRPARALHDRPAPLAGLGPHAHEPRPGRLAEGGHAAVALRRAGSSCCSVFHCLARLSAAHGPSGATPRQKLCRLDQEHRRSVGIVIKIPAH